MEDRPVEWSRGAWIISTHRDRLDLARVVTDLATYGYLTDVVVASERRSRGIGSWLTDCVLAHPDLQGFRRLALLTRDAEALYARAGFVVGAGTLLYMERKPPEDTDS